ncbi:olfactory receptor-like protein OLF4-like [Scleropages formosus]|uniref:Olfactory receptor-like protein OLF4-like n=1 Tax=Scleropages formosus TaxID=113540 RepID=A0A0P7UD31_SCLFO|nr:olfactory receptor-like protein OLF4-like [Scleropages formosus]
MDFSVRLNSSGWCSLFVTELNENGTELDKNLHVSRCMFWSMFSSEAVVCILGVIFLALCLLSSIVNGCTLLGLGRSHDLSWEPRFAILKSLIISDMLFTLTQGLTVLHCLLHRRTLAFGTWCLAQYFVGTICIFCALLTITMMAVERYLYVCHAIHYLNIVTVRRRQLAVGVVWLLSVSIASTNMLLLLCLGHSKFGTATAGLLCEPDTIERHMGFPRAAAVFRKTTGVGLTLLCILIYSFSYRRMYQEARNAVEPFHHANTRAHRTVLFYGSMFILQLVPCLAKIVSDAFWEFKGTEAMMAPLPSPSPFSPYEVLPSHSLGALHISLLVLLFVPPCINPLIYGIRNLEVRQSLLRLCRYRHLRQLFPIGKEETLS